MVWVVHVPRHAPRKPVYAHDAAWQRDHDKLVPLREDRLAAILASKAPPPTDEELDTAGR